MQNSGVELFPELLCDRVGHIPVAAFAVRLAGHPKKEALAALYDFQIFHHKAVIEFHAGKAHEVFHRFDDPHAYIQLQRCGRGGVCNLFLHGFLLSGGNKVPVLVVIAFRPECRQRVRRYAPGQFQIGFHHKAHGVCFRKFFGELSIESRVRLSVRTLFVTPRHTASFPLRVSMARSLLMAAEDGFCKTACFE